MTRPFGGDKLPPGVRRVLRLPWSRPEMRRDLDDEVQFHLQMRIDDLMARGMSEPEAESEALRRLGDAGELKQYLMRVNERRALADRAIGWFQDWLHDVALAWRQARHNAAFTALAVVTLALGIGANTAIFSVVHRLLIAPLPYPNGNSIVVLRMGGDRGSLLPPSGSLIDAWTARAHSIGPVAAIAVDGIAVQDFAEQDTVVALITPNYLSVLGLRPSIGRGFTTAEAQGRASTVAMITDGLWKRSYGGRSDVLGKTLSVDGKSYTIVGVTPPAMGNPASLSSLGARLHSATPSIFFPAPADSMEGSDAFARLRPGVSKEQAAQELQTIAATVPVPTGTPVAQWTNARCCVRALGPQDMLDSREVRAVKVLFLAVAVLLLIACANVASLLMSRAWTRRREFAVRAALGAGRGRLARLVLTESVMTALAGGLLGVVLAWQGLRIIVALRPPTLADLAGARLEPAVLLWSVGISVAAGVLFGSAPALFAGGRSVGDVLRSESLTASGDAGLRRVRSGLIVVEIAMALVLLVGAGLLVRSFVALETTPLGFEPHGLMAFDVLLGPSAGRERAQRIVVEQSVMERLRSTPGVTGVAVGSMPGEPWHLFGVTLESDPDATGRVRSVPDFGVTLMTPNYLSVAGMPLLAGRMPVSPPGDAAYRAGPKPGQPVVPREVAVDRALAHALWPDGNVIGQRMYGVNPRSNERDPDVVVGLVEGAHIPSVAGPAEPAFYQPTIVPGNVSYLVRVTGDPHVVAPQLRKLISETNSAAVARATPHGDDNIRDALAPSTFAMALLGTFALIALVLSAVGLYGMIAYSVSQRTREIGVRMALGAEPRAIAGLVVGHGIRLALAGVVLGAAGAFAGTRLLNGMLYDVGASDPATFATISVLVVGISLVASYVPARRAVKVDPMESLRTD